VDGTSVSEATVVLAGTVTVTVSEAVVVKESKLVA
jgi:hypothetical protein